MKKVGIKLFGWGITLGFLAAYLYAFYNPTSPLGINIKGIVIVDFGITVLFGALAIFGLTVLRHLAGIMLEDTKSKALYRGEFFDEEQYRNNVLFSTPMWVWFSTPICFASNLMVIMLGFPIMGGIMILFQVFALFARIAVKPDWRTATERGKDDLYGDLY